jgi:hypothetical protein
VWDGEVPMRVAPDDQEESEAAPPAGAGDAPEAEPDDVAQEPTG